jgi:hypothetical protein
MTGSVPTHGGDLNGCGDQRVARGLHVQFLQLFLLQLNRLISLSTYPLGKDFFKSLGLNNLYQDVMALLDEAEAESS